MPYRQSRARTEAGCRETSHANAAVATFAALVVYIRPLRHDADAGHTSRGAFRRAAVHMRNDPPEHQRRRVRRAISVLARAAIAAGILAFLASRIDVARTLEAIRDAPVHSTLGAFALWLVGWWIVSYRLAVLMGAQGVRVGTFGAFEINLSSLFYALALPGGEVTGMAVRVHRLSRTGGRYVTAFLAIALDRTASIAAVTAIGFAFWLLDAHAKPAIARLVLVVGTAVVAAIVGAFVAWRQRRRAPERLRALVSGWLRGTGGGMAERFDVVARLPARTIALLIVVSFVSQVPGIVGYAILAHALALPLSVVTLGWIRSTVMIVTALPISIAGLGVREGLLLVVLRYYGIADHDALAFSLLVFTVTILGVAALGAALEARQWLMPRRAAMREVTE